MTVIILASGINNKSLLHWFRALRGLVVHNACHVITISLVGCWLGTCAAWCAPCSLDVLPVCLLCQIEAEMAKIKPFKKVLIKEKILAQRRRSLIWCLTFAWQPKHSVGWVLPNSAISWGFTIPTSDVCDWTLVNTQKKTESQFTDDPANPRRETEKRRNWGRVKKKRGRSNKKMKGESEWKTGSATIKDFLWAFCCQCQGAEKQSGKHRWFQTV